MKFVLSIFCLAMSTTLLHAEDVSPIFGSATQSPIVVSVDPMTGLPVAAIPAPTNIVVTAR